MVERRQITDSMEQISVGKEDAQSFFMSDVGMGALHAYMDMVQEFVENQDRMFNTYPELVMLFEFAVFVRGPSSMARNPGNGLFTFLVTAVGSSQPEALLSDAIRCIRERGINV